MTKKTTLKLKTNYVHCCWDYPTTFIYVSNLFQPICTFIEESSMIQVEASKVHTWLYEHTAHKHTSQAKSKSSLIKNLNIQVVLIAIQYW